MKEKMIVDGMKRTENVGETLFTGTFEECIDFCKSLNLAEFYDLHICEENGLIRKYIWSYCKAGEDYGILKS